MRISFIDAADDTVIVQVISGICYCPKENFVQVWTPELVSWKCQDVSQYQYSIWSSKLLTDGYLSIHDTRYKWSFDE